MFICGCTSSVFQEGVFAGTCYLEQVPNAIHKIPHRVEGHDVWVRVWRIPRVVRVRGPLACYSLRESGDYITLHYIAQEFLRLIVLSYLIMPEFGQSTRPPICFTALPTTRENPPPL